MVVDASETQVALQVALIVGGGPGVSASCARCFHEAGFSVAVAARRPEKQVLLDLEKKFGTHRYACDAADPDSVAALFDQVTAELGSPRLVVHNIDGRVADVFRKGIAEVDPALVRQTLDNGAFSAFLVAREAAARMLAIPAAETGHRGTIIFTNASASLKGYPRSGAFAMACHAKSGLAESVARELMPEGIHVVNVPIDGAIGWTQEDGSRKHWLAGADENDKMLDPDHIAELYLQLHRQHRSTWACEVVLRPWLENW